MGIFTRRVVRRLVPQPCGPWAGELLEPRVLLASLSGTVFEDDDLNGLQNLREGGVGGRLVYLDQNNNGSFDTASTTAQGPYLPRNFDNATPLVKTVSVSGLGGAISHVRVGSIEILHQNVADVDAFLVSPAGTRVELFTDVGGTGNDFDRTALDDDAAQSIATAAAPFFGTFRPESPLSALNGESPDGVWRQEIFDDSSGPGGLFQNWSLKIDVAYEPFTLSERSGAYSFAAGIGTHRVREVEPDGWGRTAPASGVHTVFVRGDRDSAEGLDFGTTQRAVFSGRFVEDVDGDGALEPGEPALSGWTVFADRNNNGSVDAEETSEVTDALGNYGLNVPAGPGNGTRATVNAFSRTLAPCIVISTS